MSKDDQIKGCEENLLHVYNRFSVVFDHGKGYYLYDCDGKEYLDFGSGIGVMAFGYADPEFTDAIKAQADKILHTSNLYYHTALADAAEKICHVSGMDKVFFTNSGAEAIEGALKTAKKYFYKKNGRSGARITAMEHSFHGRTVGAVSVTGNPHYREAFYPLMDGVDFAQFNNYDSVLASVSVDTCAILLETVQGEGGIHPADREFLQKVRALCDERDILLIVDEIQCGLGRCGSMYAFTEYDIRPDILCSAKALGSGIPVGAFLVTSEVAASSLEPGDHGSTYGGNPLACAAVSASLGILEGRDLPTYVKKTAPYLESRLQELVSKYDFIIERRGRGFMQGLQLDEKIPVGQIVTEALEAGLVILSAGGNTIRLLPPLIMDEAGIDKMIILLDGILSVH